MTTPATEAPRKSLRHAIATQYRSDETEAVERLLATVGLSESARARVAETARDLVAGVRARRTGKGGLDAFLLEYGLSNQEGVVLLCIAEALLRIPDSATADRLIRDKLTGAHWKDHLGHSASVLVNASTWALMLTGQFVALHDFRGKDLKSILGRLVERAGEPLIREAVVQAMRILGHQFVIGHSVGEALSRSKERVSRGYRYSYDMLGEAAQSADQAARYFSAYEQAIGELGRANQGLDPFAAPEVSVKLSALHPRYEFAQRERVVAELGPRLLALANAAQAAGVGLVFDAEESEHLELGLDLFERLATEQRLAPWLGLGLAVQSYQKRAPAVIEWLADLARERGTRLRVRLVKGAYWDAEIKRAQERGLDGYPVYTRKVNTDLAYLVCAQRLLTHRDAFFLQFATHNAHTVAAVLEMAGYADDFELQCLHGMGEALYDQVLDPARGLNVPCRVYAPVGHHAELLPYLVRRLLENGANTSFVNRLIDDQARVDEVVADPISMARQAQPKYQPEIPLPPDIYQPERRNARGLDLTDPLVLPTVEAAVGPVKGDWAAAPMPENGPGDGPRYELRDPADRNRVLGWVQEATPGQVAKAMTDAAAAARSWDTGGAEMRATCLLRMADLLEERMPDLMAIAVHEAGKSLPDALAEVREAVDFCRYYAARCREAFVAPQALPGPAAERNRIGLHGRGVFACVSPWNFPLAIFTGQVAAALAAGNAVVAKPAEQTPLMAARAVSLFYEAGVPPQVLHLLPGDGPGIGAALIADPRVAGVAFTGSVATARAIYRMLAAKDGPIVPLIAETGGQNAMIVDSSALPEQVVADALTSAFQSAGQRCSALRVMFVQADIAPKVLDALAGAMAELRVGDPALASTDVGPVIDDNARAALLAHAARMRQEATLVYRCELPPECRNGTYIAPHLFEIERIDQLHGEVFGPMLHVIRYRAAHLDNVIEVINGTGFGLTLGIHSRIDETIEHIVGRVRVGNIYVNRSMIGAVVGAQPFGGEGLSGTGPKAGGPRYLHRFATERTVSVNVAAQGGDPALLSID